VTTADVVMPLMLVWFVLMACCGVWAKFLRGRDPRSLVLTTSYQGGPATAVRGRNNYVPTAVFRGITAGLLVVVALPDWSTDKDGTVMFLGIATYFAIGAWLFATGRVGDETVWFTRDGLHQRANGLEQGMRWGDVAHMRLRRDGVELVGSSSASIAAHRYAPRAWVGLARSVDPTMVVLMTNFSRDLHLAPALATWATDEYALMEIGRPEAVERLLGTRE
jgi:hypothetical protein